MFLQKSEIGLLFDIFNIFGTPGLEEWPSLVDLPEWKHNMPKFRGMGLRKFRGDLSRVGKLGLDLMKKMMKVNPNDRISCCEALRHPYFSALIDNID